MALRPRNIEAETSISKAMNKLKVAQQEMYSSPAKALKLLYLAESDINKSYASLAKRMGIEIEY